MQMKKEITFKKALLLIAILLWGVMSANAMVTITVGNNAVVPGSNYNTIQAAYDYVKGLSTLSEPYIIELQSTYNPASGVTTETFPIKFVANTASATNNITIKPATGAKITLAVPNQTIIATVTASAFTSSTTSIDLSNTGIVSSYYGDISYMSPASSGITVTTTASSTAATITSGTLTSGKIYTVSGNANIPANTTFTYSGSNSITLSAAATAAGTGVATTVTPTIYIAGIGVFNPGVGQVFKSLSSVSGSNLTFPTGTFTANSVLGNKLFIGQAQTKVFYFNGGDYITIDGVSRTDATTGLTIQNPNCVYAQTILFDNVSTYNVVRNCVIRGANQTGAWNNGFQGTVYFAGATNNTIEYNDVFDMNDSNIPYPICAFQMTAAGGTNAFNTVQNNNICNISNQYAGNGTCAVFQFGSENATNTKNNAVLNNKIFWTGAATITGTSHMINCGSTLGLNNRFEGNTIGYRSADGTGTADLTYTVSGSTIYVLSNAKNFTCKNNTISNMKITSPTGGKSFVGFQLPAAGSGAVASADNCYGNTFQNIELNSNGGAGTLYGILISAAPIYNLDIKNNVIKSLTCQSSNTTYPNTILGISTNFGASGTLAINCIGNEVSNLTAGSSGSTANNTITAFMSGGMSNVFEKNLIYNLNTITSGHSSASSTYASSGASGQKNITLTSASGFYVGDIVTGTGVPANSTITAISSNTITVSANLTAQAAGTYSTTSFPFVKGMRFATSKSDGCTIKNNIFRLGTDVSSDVEISAIINEGLSNNTYPFNIYHNSIYIGGGTGLTLTKPSHCLSRTATATSGLITIKNNIFSNQRTNSSGGAVNQIYNLYAAADITNSDHNLYEYGSLFGTVTTTSPTTYSALSNWTSAKPGLETGSIDQTSPQFVDPANATTPDLRISAGSIVVDNKGADLSPAVTDDYYGSARSGLTPNDLGAYAYISTNPLATYNYYRSAMSGSWGTIATWESSFNNADWATATLAPTSSAVSVSIQNGHEVTVDANATAPALTVNGGGKLTLNSTYSLSANSLTLQSDATNGTGTFVDLNTTGGLTVSGTTMVNQNLSSPLRTWYLSSPVAGAQPSGMDRIKSYNEADNSWPTLFNSGLTPGQTPVAYGANSFETGKGYLVVPVSGNNIAFTGALNTGVKSVTLKKTVDAAATKSGFNLIGNPYPSYLDWTAVYTANADKLSDATMWYRTKVETLTPGVYEYKFWTVNGEGVGSVDGATKEIPPMQAFWVRSNANNNVLTLNKDMRSHAPSANKLLKAPAAINNVLPLVRLQVSNGANTDETVIYFSANASDGRDAYDAPKMSNENTAIPEIYTTLGTERLVINGMNSIPLDQEIGLGFEAGNAASFSLKAIEVRNLPANVRVMLKDKVTNAETDITDGVSGYEFTPLATSDTRFSLIFRTAGAVTGLDKHNDGSFNVYSNQKNQITLLNSDLSGTGSIVSVYNAVGQKLLSKQITGSTTILEGNFTAGVYVVKVNNTSMKVSVK